MKRIAIILLAILLCAGGALAEERAAVKLETPLLGAPHEGGELLMVYYIGARVEVIREANETYVQVNVGEPGGSLMGYMKKDDLVFGEEAIRALRAELVDFIIGAEPVHFYSYMDTGSEVIDDAFYFGSVSALGYKDSEWLHVRSSFGQTGFVSMDEAKVQGKEHRPAFSIVVEPTQDELSIEEAIAEGKARLLADREMGVNLYMGMDELTAEGLEACEAHVRVLYRYDYPDTLLYELSFIAPDKESFYAYINLEVSGKQVIEHNYGNG